MTYSKLVIICLLLICFLLMFAMTVEIVPCTESFASIESIVANINNDSAKNATYMGILSTQDTEINGLYDKLYNIKNRVRQLQ